MERDHIVIEHRKITTAEDWLRVTKDVESDDHENSYRIQLQYCNLSQEKLSPDTGFLMVSDKGEVRANGSKNDPRTYFDIIHNFIANRYWIICKGGRCKDYIIYMKGCDLKTRKSAIGDEKDQSTYFMFKSRGARDGPPYKVTSFSGVPLQFNNQGKYLEDPPNTDHTDYNDPYYFVPYLLTTEKCTTV